MENFQNNYDMNDSFQGYNFNPISQYEQGYYYYRYLCMQMEYKIKCKQYENLCYEKTNSFNHSNNPQGRSA